MGGGAGWHPVLLAAGASIRAIPRTKLALN